jgi:hypothetical protein
VSHARSRGRAFNRDHGVGHGFVAVPFPRQSRESFLGRAWAEEVANATVSASRTMKRSDSFRHLHFGSAEYYTLNAGIQSNGPILEDGGEFGKMTVPPTSMLNRQLGSTRRAARGGRDGRSVSTRTTANSDGRRDQICRSTSRRIERRSRFAREARVLDAQSRTSPPSTAWKNQRHDGPRPRVGQG